MRDIDIANLSVHLSVLDVTVSDENGLTYRHRFFTMLVNANMVILTWS